MTRLLTELVWATEHPALALSRGVLLLAASYVVGVTVWGLWWWWHRGE